MIPHWSPKSWEQRENNYAFHYPDPTLLPAILKDISQSDPLVTAAEIDNLQLDIALAGRGQAFILQAGDCAEEFHSFASLYVDQQIDLLLKMRAIISQETNVPVVTIGRIAGQYAKPRTVAYEIRDGLTLPSYQGDLINQPMFNRSSREPNPNFLMLGYQHAKLTRNLMDQKLLGHSPSVYTSHEALHLPYEQALTHQINGRWYLLSTHLPWIGVRTAFTDSAHVEFLRGVENPIGLKVGPNLSPKVLVQLIERLNPHGIRGRLVLITRIGSELVEGNLPLLINAVAACGIPVTWMCDPMHGNTVGASTGIKTRHMNTIMREMHQSMSIHEQMGSIFSGAHFELTAQNVTECLGGEIGVTDTDLNNAYHTLVDPRLNNEQSMEIARYLNHFLRNKNYL